MGWKKMALGRITQKWSEVRKMGSRGKMETGRRWRTKVIKIILNWLHEKWIIRCQMYQKPEEDLEHKAIYEECIQWWETRETKGLTCGDAYLRNPRQGLRREQSKDYLREWLRTREVAEEAYSRYMPKETQPTLHRWLVRSTNKS